MGLWDVVWIIAAFKIIFISGCNIPDAYQYRNFLLKTRRNQYVVFGFTNDSIVNQTYLSRSERDCRTLRREGEHVVIHDTSGKCYWMKMMDSNSALMMYTSPTGEHVVIHDTSGKYYWMQMMDSNSALMMYTSPTVFRTIADCLYSPPTSADVFRIMPEVEQNLMKCPFRNFVYTASLTFSNGTTICKNHRQSTIAVKESGFTIQMCDDLDSVTVNLPTKMHCMATTVGTFAGDDTSAPRVVLLGAYNSSYIFPSTLHCVRYVVSRRTISMSFRTMQANSERQVYAECGAATGGTPNLFAFTLTLKPRTRSANHALPVAVIVGFASGLAGICLGSCLTTGDDILGMMEESEANTESVDSFSDQALALDELRRNSSTYYMGEDEGGEDEDTVSRIEPPLAPVHYHGSGKFHCTGCGTTTDLAIIHVRESPRPSVAQDDIKSASASPESSVPRHRGTITTSSTSENEGEGEEPKTEQRKTVFLRRVSTHSRYLQLLGKYKAGPTMSLKITDKKSMATIRARRAARAAELKRQKELSKKYGKKHSICKD